MADREAPAAGLDAGQTQQPRPGRAGLVAVRAALVAAALNLVAPLAILLLLRPGLPVPGSTPVQRIDYIEGHRALWWAGWLAWHAAAVSLLAFYAALALRWWRRAPVRCLLALLLAAAGLAADLSAQAVYMTIVPELTGEAFTAAEAAIGVVTGYLGNGLYTLAGTLLVWAGAGELPRGLVLLSLPVWLAGAALSGASLAQSATGQVVSTALLFPALVLWCALVGLWLRRAS